MKFIEIQIPVEIRNAAKELCELYENDKPEEFCKSESVWTIIRFATDSSFVKKMVENGLGPRTALLIITKNEAVAEILDNVLSRAAPLIIIESLIGRLSEKDNEPEQNAPSSSSLN